MESPASSQEPGRRARIPRRDRSRLSGAQQRPIVTWTENGISTTRVTIERLVEADPATVEEAITRTAATASSMDRSRFTVEACDETLSLLRAQSESSGPARRGVVGALVRFSRRTRARWVSRSLEKALARIADAAEGPESGRGSA